MNNEFESNSVEVLPQVNKTNIRWLIDTVRELKNQQKMQTRLLITLLIAIIGGFAGVISVV